MAHLANPPPVAPAPRVLVLVGAPDSVPVAPLPVQLSAVAREGSGGWPKCLGPCTSMGGQEEAPGSWLRIGAAPAVVAIWGVNQWKEDLSLCLSLTVYNSTCQIKTKQNKTKNQYI